VDAANCDFARDETYILRLRNAPFGIYRIDQTGEHVTSFANVDDSSLNGIAFDTVGAFGHRLLTSAGINGKTQIAAIDCKGSVQLLTNSAPVVEGGLAVAPIGFGSFGGALIAPDELSGNIYAISPDGTSRLVVNSGLLKGGDIGVESVAFVPKGFTRGGYVYYSDRATPGNPHPGTDHVLRLSSADLVAEGVKDGDMLAATEGGATMIDVRCDTSCRVTTLASEPASTAHGEGHLVFTLSQAGSASPNGTPSSPIVKRAEPLAPIVPALVALAAAVLAGVAAALLAVAASRRRR
jgi:hypothetical protein